MVNRSSSQPQKFDTQLSLLPLRASPSPTGYAAPASIQGSQAEDQVALSQLAAKILQDPLAMRKLSDRVFELLREELQIERERNRGYGRRR
jgi:hypothetical protein